jgi:outer membrane lipoprotein
MRLILFQAEHLKMNKPNMRDTIMRATLILLLMIVTTVSATGCAGVSSGIKAQGAELVAFQALEQNPGQYQGKTVILGGYVLEIRDLGGNTLISVLQAPLDFRYQPKSKDLSQGRFVTLYNGTLDSTAYTPGRQITLRGTVARAAKETVESCPSPCIQIHSEAIHLWEDYSDVNYKPWPQPPFNYNSFRIH